MAKKSGKIAADVWVRNVGELLTMAPSLGEGPLGLIRGAAVAMDGADVVWVGRDGDLAASVSLRKEGEEIDGAGRVMTPGLVDCHTHTVFAGGREGDFEARAAGKTYAEIAAAGGGISTTVRATRAASFDELLDSTLARASRALAHGITTLEIKSGYGLELSTELKMLEVIQAAGLSQPATLVATFLGAHTLPPERRHERETYVREVVEEMIPRVAAEGLAEFCDVFCEKSAFTLEEARAILTAGQRHGLKARLHADQLSPGGGAGLAAELGAVSADHLEFTSDEDIAAMARAGVTAVLLPGAAMFLGMEFPSARRFLDAGVEVALATDFNPGSSPTQSPLLMGTLAVTRMKMLPHEALRALTLGGARALGRQHRLGSVEVGKAADLALFDATDHRSLLYHFGGNPCKLVIKDGAPV